LTHSLTHSHLVLGGQGDHRRAHRAAALAMVAEPQDADVQEAAAAAQKAAIQGSVVAAWSAAVAAESARQEARELKHAAAVAARNARRASSLPKARQGLTKPIMRLLHIRLCCACRALRPRALMWRVMQLRPPHAVAPKPERKRKIRRRWVLPKPPPTEPFVPDPAALALHNKIRLARLPGDAPELAAAQADEAVWTSERRGARSVYVCRTRACVAFAARKKGQAMVRGLGASVPPPVLEALQAANEVACNAAGGDKADAVGLPEHVARLIEAHMPRVPPEPPSMLKGAYDRWTAPPSGPK
jgi:predicted RNA-binding protein YlxR (DUF448 family)